MKKLIITGALLALPFGFIHAAYYLDLGGVEGETTESSSATGATSETTVAPTRVQTTSQTGTSVQTQPQEGSTDALLEIKGIEGEASGGKVEYEWKVEEGESAQSGEKGGTEDINIGVGENAATASGNDRLRNAGPVDSWPGVAVSAREIDGWDDEEKQTFMATVKTWAEVKSEQDLKNFATGILLEDDRPAETLSLNFEEIKLRHTVPGKFLGLINVSLNTETKVDSESRVKVKFPWYAFLYKKSISASELETAIATELTAQVDTDEAKKEGSKQEIELESWSFGEQARILQLVSNVLKTKHDTAKNSVGNIR